MRDSVQSFLLLIAVSFICYTINFFRLLKEKRRTEQQKNVERKKKLAEKKEVAKDKEAENNSENEDDAEWYRAEVGEEPDESKDFIVM